MNKENMSEVARTWADRIAYWRDAKGFRTDYGNIQLKTGLVIEEVGEAMSGERHKDEANIREEIADGAIRILDMIGSINFEEAEASDPRADESTRGTLTWNLMRYVVPHINKAFIGAERGDAPERIEFALHSALDGYEKIAKHYQIDLTEEIRKKMLVNEDRPMRHNKAF